MARFACMLGWGALALALAPTAHAGPTGTSESGSSDSGSSSDGSSSSSSDGTTTESGSTSSESTTDGSTTTSTDSGSDTTTTSGTTMTTGVDDTGGCNRCDEGPGTITITSPGDGANVDAPFPLNVTVTPTCSCDRCPCTMTAPMYTQIFLDTVAILAPCYELECTWDVTADVGTHTIYAAATFGPDDTLGTTIEVHVQSVAPGTDSGITSVDDGPPPGTDTTGGSANVGEDAPKGCGCAAPVERRDGAWLVVLVALLRRRR